MLVCARCHALKRNDGISICCDCRYELAVENAKIRVERIGKVARQISLDILHFYGSALILSGVAFTFGLFSEPPFWDPPFFALCALTLAVMLSYKLVDPWCHRDYNWTQKYEE